MPSRGSLEPDFRFMMVVPGKGAAGRQRMEVIPRIDETPRAPVSASRTLADQAFLRAADAPLVEGNAVRLLRDGPENYPAWLAAIRAARRHVLFENYIFTADATGAEFADALIERAQAGVRVRVIYDWLGGFRKTSRSFLARLRAGDVEVRCYNPPRFDSPLGWLSRDHRKLVAVDSEVGFVAGLCVGQLWAGNPAKAIEPWRDTGVEIRGPAVAEIEQAFAQVWTTLGEPIGADELIPGDRISCIGETNVRIVASKPATSRTFRLDQLIAAFARQRMWLTDAYYVGLPMYVQALTTASRQGVDVRLLVPGATDIPLVRTLTRSGYRPLLEAGVRIFEWNGVMLHAKAAVADGRWARVGSTNLNIASWLGNYELDAVVEDEAFAREMEAMYLVDLENATEVVLNEKRRVCSRVPLPPKPARSTAKSRGSTGRAAAGAIRIGNAVGAAITNRRVIGPLETRVMFFTGFVLLALAVLIAFFPRVFAWPAVAIMTWFAIALFYHGAKARRGARQGSPVGGAAGNLTERDIREKRSDTSR